MSGRRGDLVRGPLVAVLLAVVAVVTVGPAAAFEFAGTRQIVLHARDGSSAAIGTARFEVQGGAARFAIDIDTRVMHDHFLSMKEFKCREGRSELLCHVPYPYASPRTVGAGELRWLEHALLFFFKTPSDFGARLWNGVYFQFAERGETLVGTPQAIDLNLIGAPPDDLTVPPYDASLRSEIDPGAREFIRLTIE